MSDRFIVVNEEKFLNLQLYISILNSVCMIIFGIVAYIFSLPNVYVITYPLIFHAINWLIKPISRIKHYISNN
jgi:hypothetical protein